MQTTEGPMNVPDEIPKRFIDGCDGDLVEARRRWDITRHWREVEGVNKILQDPQPHFDLIKTMYPHYHAGRGKAGNVVFYERPGEFEIAKLLAQGVKVDDMIRHWLFVTEYQWEVLCQGDQSAKGISVMDMKGVKLGDLAGDNLSFLKRTISYANHHYPERSHVIFVINAPYFFSLLWKLVKPMVHVNTQRKLRILSTKETLQGLQEHIDISQIPEFYGGGLDFGGHDSCRFNSPEAVAMAEYVRKLNEKHRIHSEVGGQTSGDLRESFDSGSGKYDAPTANPSEGSDKISPNGSSFRLGSDAVGDWSVASAIATAQQHHQHQGPPPEAAAAEAVSTNTSGNGLGTESAGSNDST